MTLHYADATLLMHFFKLEATVAVDTVALCDLDLWVGATPPISSVSFIFQNQGAVAEKYLSSQSPTFTREEVPHMTNTYEKRDAKWMPKLKI